MAKLATTSIRVKPLMLTVAQKEPDGFDEILQANAHSWEKIGEISTKTFMITNISSSNIV